MEVRKKQTYTNDGSKGTNMKSKVTRGFQKSGYRVEQKEKVDSVPQQPIWKKSTDTQKEIQNRVVRSADRGNVETDPTQGWGSKLNNDVLYNGLQSKKQADKFTKAYKNTLQRKKK